MGGLALEDSIGGLRGTSVWAYATSVYVSELKRFWGGAPSPLALVRGLDW